MFDYQRDTRTVSHIPSATFVIVRRRVNVLFCFAPQPMSSDESVRWRSRGTRRMAQRRKRGMLYGLLVLISIRRVSCTE